MLKTLCEYNNVEITHTFSTDEIPVIKVRCVKNTSIIEITNFIDNTVKLSDNIEKTAEEIQLFINENVNA